MVMNIAYITIIHVHKAKMGYMYFLTTPRIEVCNVWWKNIARSNFKHSMFVNTVETQNTEPPLGPDEKFGFWFKEGNLKAKKEEEKSGPIRTFGFPWIPVFWVFSSLSFHWTILAFDCIAAKVTWTVAIFMWVIKWHLFTVSPTEVFAVFLI